MAKYLIVNGNNKILAEAETPYEANRIANSYADLNRKTYYIYNIATKTFKPCMGYHIYGNRNPYSRYNKYI